MLNWAPELHAIGVAEMDATHEEFLHQLARLSKAGNSEFSSLFDGFVMHTRIHFEGESRLMRACGFAAIAEHESEHRRVLADLALIGRGVAAGRLGLARAYVAIGMPDWFRKHLLTMDSALAAKLKAVGVMREATTATVAAPAPRMPYASSDRAW